MASVVAAEAVIVAVAAVTVTVVAAVADAEDMTAVADKMLNKKARLTPGFFINTCA
jgi:hypothetical protein